MSEKYQSVQIEPNKWYSLHDYDRSECCDCGLVHIEEFKLEKGRIFFRTRVDRRRTNAIRKANGVTIKRKTP